jgi:outer membrane cobalamin receptor
VINIISKGVTAEFGGSVFAEAGTDGYLSGAIDFSGPIDDVGGFSLFVTAKDDGEPVEGTTFDSESASGRLSFANGENWDLRIFGNYADSAGTAFPEESGGYDLAVLRDVDTRTTEQQKLGLNGSVGLSDRSRLNVLATWYDQDSSYFSPGVAPGIRDPVPANGADSQLERTDLAVNVVVDVSEDFVATVGVDYYDEAGVSDGFIELFPGFSIPSGFRFDRNVTGIFGELHYQTRFGATLLASVRRDDPNTESGETTSKLGMFYGFDEDRTTVRANWGQGFSLPGFFALASPLVGNPDLRPETSESFDIGITRWSRDRRIGATLMVFRNEFLDLIDFDSTVFSMVNRERLEVDGAELQLDYAINKTLDISVQATYLDMEFGNSTMPIRQRPDWRGGMTVRWAPSDRWLLDASWLNVGKTFDSSIPTGDRYLDGYNRVDVTATFKPTDKTSVLLSIDNLFDAGYAEAIGFPSPGTRARLGIRLGL